MQHRRSYFGWPLRWHWSLDRGGRRLRAAARPAYAGQLRHRSLDPSLRAPAVSSGSEAGAAGKQHQPGLW